MALTDVDETYRKPVMGKAFYAEPQLSLTRLFDRLKLQESSGKKGADSKTVSEELALTNDSQMLSLKAGSGRGRAEEERERQKHVGRAGEKKTPGGRSEADVGSRTAHAEGASAGGARARSQSRRRRRPKVDYQQVFTRHINQIFIRGENHCDGDEASDPVVPELPLESLPGSTPMIDMFDPASYHFSEETQWEKK
ncbi:U7 snRNA-associated Sm-like protein LSm11, partial [Lamprotornis superbus]